MREKLKVAVIGAGGIARGAHIPHYRKLEDRVEIVALTDIVKEKAEQVAAEFSIPRVFTDYEEMLNAVDIDAVSICTPNKFHARAAVAALEAGCHVLCEKPPALTVEEACAMEEAAGKAGKILTYGFHYRYAPEVETLKRFIEAGELGEIYAGNVMAVRRRGIPGWGVFTDRELQGGGALMDIGVHMLDAALYLMGYPEPVSVMGVTYQKIGNRKGVGLMGKWDWEHFSVEDMARGMIVFQNGASLLLESAFAANVEKKKNMNVSLMGDRGGADLFPLRIYQEKHETLLDVTPAFLPEADCRKREIETFVEGCLTGRQPVSTPREGVILQRITNGLYQSAQTGEAVKFSQS